MKVNRDEALHTLTDKVAARLNIFDSASAVNEVFEAVVSHQLSIDDVYLDCLSGLMIETGASWQAGRTTVWQEHLVSGIVRTIIDSLSPEITRQSAAPNGKTVLLACPPEEQHDIGLRMLADLYRLRGWTAHFLGADVPEQQIIDGAAELKADTIILSAATHFHRLQLRDLSRRIRKTLPDVTVLVTGAAFRSGHDGWEDNEVLDPASLRVEEGGS